MKKVILSAATILTFSIIGCKSSGGGDPKTVLMSFFDAMQKKDINTAKKLATKDSESMLQMMQMALSMAPDSTTKSFDANNMELGDATISGDKATVPVKDKKSDETTNFTLKKEGGDWKVAFDKTTMAEMAKDKMNKGMNNMNGMDSVSPMNSMDTSKLMQDTSH